MWRAPWATTPTLKLKRAMDIVGASAGLCLGAPLLVGSALAVLVDLGRPVLFVQTRPGWRGALFEMTKFRTMRPPRVGEVYYRTDDDRMSRVGRVLRATSLDELPELVNVLRGQMSLVGPRPLLVEYLEQYTPEQMRRHDMPPGITGWAQVNGRRAVAFSRKLALDVWYVDNWSLGLDVKIILMTVRDLLKAEGEVPGQEVDDVDDLGFLAGSS